LPFVFDAKNHDPGTSKSETRAIIEHVDKQKNENIYDTAEFIPSEVNTDTDTESEISISKTDPKKKSETSTSLSNIALKTTEQTQEINDIQMGDTQL
jgi:CRISPR/Cas system Type II protein with McrA/HNH and RuvC-like nuclease domain